MSYRIVATIDPNPSGSPPGSVKISWKNASTQPEVKISNTGFTVNNGYWLLEPVAGFNPPLYKVTFYSDTVIDFGSGFTYAANYPSALALFGLGTIQGKVKASTEGAFRNAARLLK